MERTISPVNHRRRMTEADSTGVTAVLAGVMADLRIDYALTTEVASFARGAVRELDLARRIMHYAIETHSLPKGIDGLIQTLAEKNARGETMPADTAKQG